MHAAWRAEVYAPPPMYNISAVSLRDAGLQQGRLAKERIRGWLGTTEMTELAEYDAITGEGRAAFRQLKADARALRRCWSANSIEVKPYVEVDW